MTLRQLAYLIAVVEEGSFTKAARAQLVSQPSLSQQIRALELEVGTPLLERLPRVVRLTPAGKAFLPHARASVLSAQSAKQAATSVLGAETGELEIATVPSVGVSLLPTSIDRCRAAHPGVTIRLREYRHRTTLQDDVRDGVCDIAVAPRPERWDGPVTSLGWEEMMLIVSPSDPVARAEEPIPLEMLSDRDWVLFDSEHGLSRVVLAACAKAGFEPRVAVETSQVEAAARLAAAGLGPALVPGTAVPLGLNAAVLRCKPAVGHELAAYARQEWSPLALAYVEILRRCSWRPPPPDLVDID